MSLFPSAPSPASATSVIPASTSPSKPYFLIFFASVDEQTGKSWCPDCVRVEKTISELVPESRSSLIYVGQRSEWKQPDNPFRKAFGLTNLPTIVRVESSDSNSLESHISSAPRLIESELLDEKKFKEFLKI